MPVEGPVPEAPSETSEHGALQRLFDDARGENWFDERGIRLFGWFNPSLSANPDESETGTNGPVTFNDRANEIHFNQLYLAVERTVEPAFEHWQLGGRADFLFGTDYFFTTARGLETEHDGTQRWNGDSGPHRAVFGQDVGSLYGLAMPQLYAEIAGHDLSLKLGHFYSILGYEKVTAVSNFFVTRSYSFQYNPFTHTGALANYRLNDRWSILGGLVQGADTFDENFRTKAFLGGITYRNTAIGATVSFALLDGEQQLLSPSDEGHQRIYTVVYEQQLTRKLQYVIEHNRGHQQEAVPVFGPAGLARFKPAEWFGVSQYLVYQVNDRLGVGARLEWFRDADGYRILQDGRAGDYYELAVGMKAKLAGCVVWRNEFRWDWVDKTGIRPFDLQNNPAGGRPMGSDGSQFLFTTDLIITF